MSGLSRAFGRLFDGMALAGAALVLALVALITANVGLRASGLGAIVWTDELSEYGLYLLTLLSAPWLLRRGAHIRVDVLLTALPARAGWALELLASVLGGLVCLVLAWYAARAALDSAASGSLTIKSMVFPEWWLLAPLPLAFLLLACEFGFRFARIAAGPRETERSAAAGLA